MKFFTVGIVGLAAASQVGPIQKVIQLLGEMKDRTTAEGEVEAEQFDKYRAWCNEETDVKEDSIADGKERAAALSASIEQFGGEIQSLSNELGVVASEISGNEGDLAAATKVRNNENNDFTSADKELTETIDMLVRAKSALSRQMALIQRGSGSAADLKKALNGLTAIVDAAKINADDRAKLSAMLQASEDDDFLSRSAPQAKSYESHSSSIVQVLDDLRDKAEAEQSELRQKEVQARHAFELLKQNLENGISHSTEHLSELKQSKAEKEEGKGSAARDLATTQTTLAADETYLADVTTMCKSKGAAFESRATERTAELKAISEAIAALSGDSASGALSARIEGERAFVQVSSNDAVRERAANFLKETATKLHSVGLAQLAARFRSTADPFGKVRGMIEQMISRLMLEANNEATHKDWCDSETGKSTNLRSKHQSRVAQLSTRIDKAEASVGQLKQEVAALQSEVASMNAAEKEALEQRHAEEATFAKNMEDSKTGQEALQRAIAVLRDYYAKSFVQIKAHQPSFGGPIFEDNYEKKGDAATGVIGMLEVAQADLARMEAEERADEDAASKAFKAFTQENAVNRAAKETEIKAKAAEAGRLATSIEELKQDNSSSQKELDAVMTYLEKLRESCEVKPMSYAERKDRREKEIAALQEALEILSAEA